MSPENRSGKIIAGAGCLAAALLGLITGCSGEEPASGTTQLSAGATPMMAGSGVTPDQGDRVMFEAPSTEKPFSRIDGGCGISGTPVPVTIEVQP